MSARAAAFSHAGIYVNDLDRMLAFYALHIGLLVTDDGVLHGSRIVFLSRDAREHHQLVMVAGRPPNLEFNSINQLSFRVESLDDLRAMYRDVKASPEAAEVVAVSHGTALSVYFMDPERNRVELFLDTPWYIQQPYRVPVDLEQENDAVWREVLAAISGHPSFRPIAEWRNEMTARLRAAPVA